MKLEEHAPLFSALCLLVLLLTSCASPPTAPPPPTAADVVSYQEGVPGGVAVQTVEINARVTAIDPTERVVTLLGPEGEERTLKVGPEAVNFDQIAVGDLVKATATRELVISVGDEGSAEGTAVGVAAVAAAKGSQPGAAVAQTTRVTGTVAAIDQHAHTATLRFVDGSERTYPVRGDVELSERRLGQQVVLELTEMIAIKVEKP